MNRPALTRYARLIAGLLTTAAGKARFLRESEGDPTTASFAEAVLNRTIVQTPMTVERPTEGPLVYRPLHRYALSLATDVPAGHSSSPMWDRNLCAFAGDLAAAAAWDALADRNASTFDYLAAHQQANGAFLQATPSNNPETMWFHELAILHAVASFAIQMPDDRLRPAIARAVHFHLHETQPDHATNQPWGLPAFLLEPDGFPMADAQLHTASLHAASERESSTGVTLMLLADALYCLHKLGIRHE